ncbi:MAG: hypothetical protein ACI8S6_001937 [Myxococcota bacterium]
MLEATVLTLSSLLVLVSMLGCTNDIKLTAQAQCDGILQPEEETVDSPFDADEDGFFDAANPGCAATYAPEYLDCSDRDPDISPGRGEVTCDGLDNDCDELTPDSLDQDDDGYSDCDECDDSNADVNPGRAEVACDGIDNDCDDLTEDAEDFDGDGWDSCEDCDDDDIYQSPGLDEIDCNGIDDDCDELTEDAEDYDGDGASVCDDDCDDDDDERSPLFEEACDDDIDNNCDGEVDEACSYTGVWTMDRTISYQCADFYGILYLVDIGFSGLYIDDLGSSVSFAPTNGSTQPGTTYGTFTSATTISTENTIPGGSGGCTEIYTFSGTFLDSDTFSGAFEADFTGSGSSCSDCRTQSIIFSATR